jgi:hypothetical protein
VTPALFYTLRQETLPKMRKTMPMLSAFLTGTISRSPMSFVDYLDWRHVPEQIETNGI